MEPVISMSELKKTYANGVQALAGISFKVLPGQIVGLLGPNGAGKTTAIRILATLSRASEGCAQVCGFDVAESAKEVRRRIGYVAQTTALDLLATGRENLLFHGRLFGLTPGEIRKRTEELIEVFELGEIANRQVRTYSGGMKRRLDLATGLLHLPDVLFLDEPTNGLDPDNRHILWNQIHRLAIDKAVAILLTTHYMDEADALAHKIFIIDRGRIVVSGAPRELKTALNGDIVTIELAEKNYVPLAKEVIQSTAGVVHVIADAVTVSARVPDGAEAVPGIVEALRRVGIVLTRITVSRPTLDEVYLSATGRQTLPHQSRSNMVAVK